MDEDLKTLFTEKIILTAVIALAIYLFGGHLYTGLIFAALNFVDYQFKKKRLAELYANFSGAQLAQMRYINFRI